MRISDWSSDVCSSDLEGQVILSIASLLVGPVAGAVLVHLAAALEAVEAEGTVEIVLLVMGHGMGEAPAGRGGCLEALVAPAAIEVEVADRGAADEEIGRANV